MLSLFSPWTYLKKGILPLLFGRCYQASYSHTSWTWARQQPCCPLPTAPSYFCPCPSTPFCLSSGYSSCHLFNSLSHRTSSRHTCLNFLLYPVAIRIGWESQIPNSKTSPSLPLSEVISVYPITPPLSMAQVMFSAKHIPVLVLHLKYPGFP